VLETGNTYTHAHTPSDPHIPTVYVVDGTAAAHVQAAVDCARWYGARLIVKDTGHDCLGQ
jgi:hypothetical protein